MLAPETSVRKTVTATEPEFLGTSRVQHTGSTIMTDPVEPVYAAMNVPGSSFQQAHVFSATPRVRDIREEPEPSLPSRGLPPLRERNLREKPEHHLMIKIIEYLEMHSRPVAN